VLIVSASPPLAPRLPLRVLWPWLGLALLLLTACRGGDGSATAESAYVIAPSVSLRDRLATVFNKVAVVSNGDRVQVLERSQNRRFARVRTADGKEGWVEVRYLASQETFDAFARLARLHDADPVQADAVTRRAVNLHVLPGRNTDRLFQLKEGTRIELLQRASTPRSGLKKPLPAHDQDKEKEKDEEPDAPPAPSLNPPASAPSPADPLEDWWLVRDPQRRTGWILGRMLDVEIPLEIAQYAEGQRIVAAFVLSQVPESPGAEKKVPQYLVLLSQPRDGLPYDFDQIRVFTWNAPRRRYETAFRERMAGKLPVVVSREDFGGREGMLPVFRLRAQTAGGDLEERKYRMQGVMVRRVLAPGEKPARPMKTASPSTKHAWIGRR
jgi:lipocalin